MESLCRGLSFNQKTKYLHQRFTVVQYTLTETKLLPFWECGKMCSLSLY